MRHFIALLRAVNVGGTGKLPMTDLKRLCEEAGFQGVRTYIASGNVVFQSVLTEAGLKSALESRLHQYAGKPVGVMIRSSAEIADVVAANPFQDAPGNRLVVYFLDTRPPDDALQTMSGQAAEEKVALGRREIYVLYGAGMASSKLKIPAAATGTGRNMNTVAKLAGMALGAGGS
jgi:uncharacterized protein (DUF1697 family)